ncbi:MAG: glycosyltransferase [Candidatus Thermoplasmatota archaeon]|jgi:glycosyltransferase involved in cell wall biosynthesis|nr:glycosyltransferase [Candidatus Thermoplasmatota archaeon]MCL5963139.1 glycosyltransferase [Candidatus Thermoplasmatota archaeon]
MKIAIFSDTFLPNMDGVSTYLFYFIKELENNGHELYVFAPAPTHVNGSDKGYNIFRSFSIPFPIYEMYRLSIFPYINAIRLIKKIKPDIIHIHTPFVLGTAGFLAGRELGVPIIGTFHTAFIDMKTSFNTLLVNNLTLKMAWLYNMGIYWRCDRLIVPSYIVKKNLIKFARKPFRKEPYVIPNGIDYNFFISISKNVDIRKIFNIGKEKKIITFIGRITKDKGVYSIVNAAKKIKETSAMFVICGKGPEEENLKRIAKNMKNLIYVGFIPEEYKYPLLKESSIFILPSMADVFPISAIEAMYAGTNVLVSSEGGNMDVIGYGERGFVYDFHNEQDMVDKIMFILNNINNLENIRKNGIRYTQQIANIKYNVQNVLKIYEETLFEKKSK